MPLTPEHHTMTDREKFVYIATCMMHSPVAMSLDVGRRTAILEILRQEYCPSLTDNDWLGLALSIDKNHDDVARSIMKQMNRDDLMKVYDFVTKRWEKRK